MKRYLFVVLSLLPLGCSNSKNHEKKSHLLYFDRGELLKDPFTDSLFNSEFSEALGAFNEPMLQFAKNESIRLTVLPPFGNSYSVRIEMDSITTVLIHLRGVKSHPIKIGFDNLSLSYKIKNLEVDSLNAELMISVSNIDFKSILKDDIADGYVFLLESTCNKQYRFMVGVDYENDYRLTSILNQIHEYIPQYLKIEPNAINSRDASDFLDLRLFK